MARGRGFTRFVRPAPRTKMWIGAGVGPVTIASAATTFYSSLSAGALLLRPFTILRTRTEFLFESDQEGASERPDGAYGKIVVTETAAALGVTALPDALSDPESDWFVYQGMIHRFRFISGVGTNDPAGTHYVVDSRAMRKVGADQDIAAVFTMRASVGATLTSEGRMLIQLH